MPIYAFRNKKVATTLKRMATEKFFRADRGFSQDKSLIDSTNLHAYAIVAKGTITKAVRAVSAGTTTFTPGTGQAYLLQRDTVSGSSTENQLISRLSILNSTAVEVTVFNLTTQEYTNDVNATVETQDGVTLQTQDSRDLEFDVEAAQLIGDDAVILWVTEDAFGDLYIVPRDTAPRLQKAVAINDIDPNSAGLIQVLTFAEADTVAAATSTTITLGATAQATADVYNGYTIRINSGTGVGQSKEIASYTSGKVATLFTGDTWSPVPDSLSTYVLESPESKTGFWNHAENGRVIKDREEIWVQSIDADNCDIVRASDSKVLLATVTESGGIAHDTLGEITLFQSGTVTTGAWNWATAGLDLDELGEVYVVFDRIDLAETVDEGRIYRIVGGDCTAMTAGT